MIKHPDKYIYSLITITALIGSNDIYAQETLDINNINYSKMLSNYISYCDNLISDSTIENTTDEELTNISYLKERILESEEILSSTIDSTVLKEEYYQLVNETSLIDNARISEKENLRALIQYSRDIYNNATFGDSEGDFPVLAGEKYLEAIELATNILADSTLSDEDYAKAKDELETSITEFLSQQITVDNLKVNLLESIIKGTNLYNESIVGNEIGNYPSEVKENLLTIINLAEDIHKNPLSTLIEVKNAITSLEETIASFESFKITSVDTTLLYKKITEMETLLYSIPTGDAPGCYPYEAKESFSEAISIAKSILSTCTYKESIDMITTLEEAKIILESNVLTYEDMDRSELKRQINEAKSLYDNSEIGEKPGQYPQDSVDKLYRALFLATETNENKLASQSEINSEATKLMKEIEDFKNSQIDKEIVDLTKLTKLIDEAKYLIENTNIGTGINQITSEEKEKLQKVVDDVTLVLNSSNATQDTIDDAIIKIENAINEFQSKINTGVDKSELSREIDNAVLIQNSISDSMIGNEVGMYPEESKLKLDNTIKDAKKILADDYTTQEIVDKMTMSLKNEVQSFENSLIKEKVDKSKLNSTIKEAENLLSNAKVGTSDGLYPQEAVDNLKSTTEESKKIYQSNESTQNEVNSQVLKLENAIETFENEEIVDYLEHKESLKSEIQDCINILSNSKEGTSVGEYPTESRETFKAAIAKAEKVAAKTDKNSSTYINALDVLLKAKTKFQSSEISNEELEKYSTQLNLKLNEISKTIKEAEVGTVNGGVAENQKVALSVIYSQIKYMVKDVKDINVYKKAINLAKNALSDFNDGTIYIDSNDVVNGKKLTGVVTKSNSNPTNITMVNKEEFIPQAGIPFDIKLLLNMSGTFFLSIGVILFRREKK